jgi:hypothetical protein
VGAALADDALDLGAEAAQAVLERGVGGVGDDARVVGGEDLSVGVALVRRRRRGREGARRGGKSDEGWTGVDVASEMAPLVVV